MVILEAHGINNAEHVFQLSALKLMALITLNSLLFIDCERNNYSSKRAYTAREGVFRKQADKKKP